MAIINKVDYIDDISKEIFDDCDLSIHSIFRHSVLIKKENKNKTEVDFTC